MNADDMIKEIYNKSIGCSGINKSKEYQELLKEYDKVLKELLTSISEDKNGIWCRLENIILQLDAINEKNIYTRGFKDGAKFIMDIKL